MDTQKFQKNTFNTESLTQVREISEQLYESEAGLSDISQCISFVRVSLEKILLESGKMQIEDEEILKLQNIILKDIAIQEYISEKMGRLFPISLIEKLRFGKSLQEISQYFSQNPKLVEIIGRYDEKTITNALFITKNLDELKKLIYQTGISSFFWSIEAEKLLLIQEIFQFDTAEDFIIFLKKVYRNQFLTKVSYGTLQKLQEFGLKEEHLNTIFEDNDFENFFLSSYTDNIRMYLLSLCNCMDDIIYLSKLNSRRDLEILLNYGLLQDIISLFGIKTIQGIENIEQYQIFAKLSEIGQKQLSWFFSVFKPQNVGEVLDYFVDGKISNFLEINIQILDFLYSFYGKDIKHKVDYLSQSHILYFLREINIDFFTDILHRFDMFSQDGLDNFIVNENIVYFLSSTSKALFLKIIDIFSIKSFVDFKNIFVEYPEIKNLLEGYKHEFKNLNLLISLFHIEKKEDLIQIAASERTRLFLGIMVYKFQSIINGYKFVDIHDFIAFCEKIENHMTLIDIYDDLLQDTIHRYTKEEFLKVLQSRYFQRKTTEIKRPPSHILFECFDTEIQGKDALKLMRRKANKVLSQKEKNEDKNVVQEDKKLDLSIYVRFGHVVDYPEIADALIIFAQHYIALGYSQIFKNIRIIPRYLNEKRRPSKELFKKQKGFPETQYFNVASEKFKEALHEGSLAVFLSHSSISRGSQGFPNLISQGMGGEAGYFDISSEIELEAKYTQSDFTRTVDFEELFEEFFGNLRALEKAYMAHIKK